MKKLYWNITSTQFRRLGLTSALNPFVKGYHDQKEIDQSTSEAHLESAIKFIEEHFIPTLESILGHQGFSKDGISLTKINMPALVSERLHLFHIRSFLSSAHVWFIKNNISSIRIWPSLHYTDYLLNILATRDKISLGFVSKISKFLSRVFLPLSNKHTYRPKVFYPSSKVPILDNQKLIFVATMETHLKNIIPLLIHASNKKIPTALIVTSSFKQWKSVKDIPTEIQVFNFRDFISTEDIDKYNKDRQIYKKLFNEQSSQLKELAIFDSMDMWPILSDGFSDFYQAVLPENLLYLRIAKKILSSQPKAVINSRALKASETALLAVAQNLNICTTTVIHGLLSDDPSYHFATGRFDLSEFVYVWNNQQKQHVLKKSKIKPRDIIIDANPQWGLMKKDNLGRSEVLDLLRLPSEGESFSRIITFCATKQVAQELALWQYLISIMSLVPHTLLVIKIHPSVSKEHVLNKLGHIPRNVCIVGDVDSIPLHSLLRNSDLMITITSTTLFEALILGTPILLYRAHTFGFVDELGRYGAPVISDKDSLRNLLIANKTKKQLWGNCLRFIDNYLGHAIENTNNVSERIITSMLSE